MENVRMLDERIREQLPKRPERSNKGTFGKVLCVAGSKNMAGAAYLCAYAAYRAGAGLVRILTPEENRVILQTLLPEAVLTTFHGEEDAQERLTEAFAWADAAAVGPGLSRDHWACRFTERALREFHKPLVLDADGLNHAAALSGGLLKDHEGSLIVTPHPGEFSRLSGLPVADVCADIPGRAADFAGKEGCICVLKDAPTAIGAPDGRCFVNTTGNHGMSTGGSGDVLTGIIAGLLGQGTEALDAALLGVWLHGRAGNLAAQQEGAYGMLARHLIEYLPDAMREGGQEK